MTIEELRAAVAFLAACLRDMHQAAVTRGSAITDAVERATAEQLTADEQTRWDAGQAEIVRFEALIARHEEVLRLAAAPGSTEAGTPFTAPNVISRAGEAELYDTTTVAFGDNAGMRSKALEVIEKAKVGGMEDRHREQMERLVRSMDSGLAARIVATSSPDYRSAFIKTAGGRPELLNEAERKAMERAVTLGGTGGLAVPAVLDTTIIDTASHSTNPVRQIATVKQITGSSWKGVSSAGVTASWDGEGVEVSDDAPTLVALDIPVFKGAAFVPFSLESEDWATMEADVSRMIQVAKDDLEGAAHISGNGTTAPQGLTTALDGTAQEIAPTTAETFAVNDLFKLEAALDSRFRGNAKVLANKAWYAGVRAFGTGAVGQGTLWESLGGGQPSQLLGYPAFESSDMDSALPNAAVTAENFGIIMGDFAQGYYIIDRVGLSIELVPHLFHTGNNRPSGMRGFYAWWRTGGEVVNAKALVMLSIPTAA